MIARPPLRSPRLDVPWQASFVALAAIWGCSFWFIKVGVQALAPVEVAFWRLALGATVLLALVAVTRTRLPSSRGMWGHLAVAAFLSNSLPFVLFSYGETHVSSVLAGLINAATPLTTLLVTLLAFRQEPATGHRIVGLLVGFVGVAITLGVWSGLGSDEWRGAAACLAAICCYGVAYPYARRFLIGSGHGPLALSAGQVTVAAVLLTPALAFSWGQGPGPITGDVVAAMLALGALGSGIAFILHFHTVERAGATAASTVTYVIPLFAVLAGMLFLGERISWHEPVGGAVVLLGVAIGSGVLWRRRD